MHPPDIDLLQVLVYSPPGREKLVIPPSGVFSKIHHPPAERKEKTMTCICLVIFKL